MTALYLCNFSEFAMVSLTILVLVLRVEKADNKCIYIDGVTFLAWLAQFAGVEW